MNYFKNYFSIFIAIIFFVMSVVPVYADNLSVLISDALQNNPKIKSAKAKWLASKYAISPSRSLPDPKIEYGDQTMSGNPEMAQNPMHEKMIGLSQEVPFPGKLIEKGRISEKNAKQTQYEYIATKLSVIAELKKMYYELYFIDRSIAVYGKNKFLLEKIEKSVETNYSVGKVPQQDIFRAQTEISRLRMKLVMLNQERLSIQANINQLLNRSLETPVLTPSHLFITHQHQNIGFFYHLIDTQSPILIAEKNSVEKSNREITLSKMDYLPDVDVSATDVHDVLMHTDGHQIMVSATIPLYFFSKQNNAVREMKKNYYGELQNFYAVRREMLFKVKNAFLDEQRSLKLIQLIQNTILPQAKLTFLSGQTNYSVGKVDFLSLLTSLLALQEDELELQSEIVQHQKAIATLNELTGYDPWK